MEDGGRTAASVAEEMDDAGAGAATSGVIAAVGIATRPELVSRFSRFRSARNAAAV